MEWVGTALTGAAVSTFYTAGASPAALRAAAASFFNAFKDNLPSSVNLVIPSSGDKFEDSTGDLTGVWTDGTPTVISGADPGAFAAGVGARIVWQTSGVTNNRRVRGSTFVCPMGAGAYASNGTMEAVALGRLQTGASAMVTGLTDTMVVWSRPRPGVPGKSNVVTAGVAPDRVSWLISRRT